MIQPPEWAAVDQRDVDNAWELQDRTIATYDATVADAIAQREALLADLLRTLEADLGRVELFDTQRHFALMHASAVAEGRMIIRSVAAYDTIGKADLLSGYLATHCVRAVVRLLRSETALFRLARRHMKLTNAPPDERRRQFRNLRGRRRAVIVRLKATGAVATYAFLIVAIFGGLSALVGKLMTAVLGGDLVGMVLGPAVGAILTLVAVRPALTRALRSRLGRANTALQSNLLALLGIRADVRTRIRTHQCLIRAARSELR